MAREVVEATGFSPLQTLCAIGSAKLECQVCAGSGTAMDEERAPKFCVKCAGTGRWIIEPKVRGEAAAKVAAFVYPTMKAVEHGGSIEHQVHSVSDVLRRREKRANV